MGSGLLLRPVSHVDGLERSDPYPGMGVLVFSATGLTCWGARPVLAAVTSEQSAPLSSVLGGGCPA